VTGRTRPLLTLVSLIFVGFNGGVPTADPSGLNFIGTGAADADRLARSLGARSVITAPDAPPAGSWTWDWGSRIAACVEEITALPAAAKVIVCPWLAAAPAVPLIELDPTEWRRRVEWPTALWFEALVAGAGRCEDGGSLVVVVDRPSTLDAVGHSAAVAVADGIVNVVRSLAAREGGRGVRVNAVLSARHTSASGLLGSPPPLATFPGRIDVEVAGAVRLLLSEDAIGITGTAVSATSGRR